MRCCKAGALEEVAALAARRLDPLLPAMKAHGVPALIRHLKGEITLEEAAAIGRADTRHYAKRQFTWFRHQLPEFEWVKPEAAGEWLADVILRRSRLEGSALHGRAGCGTGRRMAAKSIFALAERPEPG